jgi:hypothetical protein
MATQLPIPGAPKILMTCAFDERDDGGTHFEFRVAKPKPKDLPFYQQVWPTVQKNYDVGLEILHSMLEERVAASTAEDERPCPSRANASSPTLFTLASRGKRSAA